MIEMLCKLSCSHKHPDKHLIKNVIDDYIVVWECSVMEAEGIYSSNTWRSVEMLHKGFFWNFSDAAKSNFITTEKNIWEQILLCSEWSQSASVKRAAFETRPGQKCRHVSVTSALGHDAAKGNNLLCEWWSRSETAGWGSLTDNWRLIHTPSVCLSLSLCLLSSYSPPPPPHFSLHTVTFQNSPSTFWSLVLLLVSQNTFYLFKHTQCVTSAVRGQNDGNKRCSLMTS